MNIIKKFVYSVIAVSIFIASTAVPSMAEENIGVLVNYNTLSFDVPPQIINDRTMVPMRAIFEGLGASVDWNQETKTVTSTKDDITIKLTIDSNIMYVNDTVITLDTPACMVDNRTLVPVRAISEAFECCVIWDDKERIVYIYSEDIDLHEIEGLMLEYMYKHRDFLSVCANIYSDCADALEEGHDYYGVTFIDRFSIKISNDERFLPAMNNLLPICDKVLQYDTSKLSSGLVEVMRHVKNSAELAKILVNESCLEVSLNDVHLISENSNKSAEEINTAVDLLIEEANRRNIVTNIK